MSFYRGTPIRATSALNRGSGRNESYKGSTARVAACHSLAVIA
jgi:hypothetical protein